MQDGKLNKAVFVHIPSRGDGSDEAADPLRSKTFQYELRDGASLYRRVESVKQVCEHIGEK